MLDYLAEHKKAVIVGGVALLILIIAVSVYFILEDMAKTARVKIIVAPSIATVKIDGHSYEAYEEIRIRPGEYKTEISAEGFETKTGELKAVENETAEIRLYLDMKEGNEDYYEKHPKDAVILGDIKAAETLERVEELAKEHPILDRLPIEIDYYTKNYAKRVKYTITYVLNDENTSFVIMIMDYTGGNYEDALEKLKARGVDLDEYKIEYKNLVSESEWGRAD